MNCVPVYVKCVITTVCVIITTILWIYGDHSLNTYPLAEESPGLPLWQKLISLLGCTNCVPWIWKICCGHVKKKTLRVLFSLLESERKFHCATFHIFLLCSMFHFILCTWIEDCLFCRHNFACLTDAVINYGPAWLDNPGSSTTVSFMVEGKHWITIHRRKWQDWVVTKTHSGTYYSVPFFPRFFPQSHTVLLLRS